MKHLITLFLLAVAITAPALPAAEPPKDTAAASFTRNKKLKGKVTVEFKNEFLKEAIKEISSQLEDQKLGTLSVHYGVGVSQNTRISYSGKDVTAEDALDGILKQLDLGYFVVSKEKDRYDGWIEVGKGSMRGYPAGVDAPKTPDKPVGKPTEPMVKAPDPKTPEPGKTTEPKIDLNDPDEKNAQLRLTTAKMLVEDGKLEDARPLLKYIIKYFPKTAAAKDAKELLEKNKQ
jgi:hypothetical protein